MELLEAFGTRALSASVLASASRRSILDISFTYWDLRDFWSRLFRYCFDVDSVRLMMLPEKRVSLGGRSRISASHGSTLGRRAETARC